MSFVEARIRIAIVGQVEVDLLSLQTRSALLAISCQPNAGWLVVSLLSCYIVWKAVSLITHHTLYWRRFSVSRQIALSAEPAWTPPEGGKWEEKDYEKDFKKLEKEAEDRLDAKVAELMSKIETTGK